MQLVTTLVVGGLLTFGICMVDDKLAPLSALGFLLLVLGAILGMGARIVVPKKIDESYVVLSSVGEPFLSSLPQAPGYVIL